MAVERRFVFVLWLQFMIFTPLVIAERHGYPSKSLHLYETKQSSSQKQRTLLLEPDLQGDLHDTQYPGREKRAVLADKSLNITTKIIWLNDSHQQLMVHWVGEGSDVIMCLARDPSSRLVGENGPSTVFISYDYGDTFENKTNSFALGSGGKYATLDKFYNHPKYNTHCVFTDSANKVIFTTTNYGRNITRVKLKFHPMDISFHEDEPHTFLAYDKLDPTKKLWLTRDFGETWTVLQEYVKAFFWSTSSDSLDQRKILYVEREEPSGTSTILGSSTLFQEKNVTLLIKGVEDFQIKDDFMFATKKVGQNNLHLYVSYKQGDFMRAQFQSELDCRDYHIADVSDTQVFVAVSHTDSVANLYMSEAMDDQSIKFALSLERIFCYFPNSTWKESWLDSVVEESFADLHKVEGLDGIYIASQVSLNPVGSNIGPEHLVTLISFDSGGEWRPLQPPLFDHEGQKSHCQLGQGCSLHLSQKFTQLYPLTRSVPILSSKSAPGIILATGVLGKSLKGHPGVFLSRDAGLTWRQVLRDYYFFNFGDHGGILVAVKYFKSHSETRELLYSTDEGENWKNYEFNGDDLRVYGLMTEPGENTTIFTMFGSTTGYHQWLILKVDLHNAFSRVCTKEDYKFWSPSSTSGPRMPCVLGRKETYERRLPAANCYNGIDYDRPIRMDICGCDEEDYECDFGFVHRIDSKECIHNKTSGFDPFAVPATCKPGQFYNRTKGYRRISGDLCTDGNERNYIPDILPCPFKERMEFLLVAQREQIMRVDLENYKMETLPIKGLKNVIAIEFDMKNNCIYWADIINSTIGRQCLTDGESSPEILVKTNLSSIEGIALDWVSNVLYFVDGMRAKIEVIRTDIHHEGRMRRTILDSSHLKNPRGIAVHPMQGYMFWTDWAPGDPSVNRANLDGSDIKQLFTQPIVEWPNGITIDHIAERIYWVDAKEDYIAYSDFDGRKFKKIISNDDKVSHPFAVAVFKDNMYWDDWKRNSIFMADKDLGNHITSLLSQLPGLMDLKVFAHSIQEGNNSCSHQSDCTHLCVGLPKNGHVCLCPDTMTMKDGKCMCPGNTPAFENGTCASMNNTCSPEYLACNNGNCVPKLWKCDGDDDCNDNTDEMNCGRLTCPANLFQCGDGKCIPPYWLCDFDTDCEDGSDEEHQCTHTSCSKGQFRCNNGQCITQRWRCDFDSDCRDGSDEMDCTQTTSSATCKPGEFMCTKNQQCIPNSWRCDNDKDCLDGSDEVLCTNNSCESWQFECKSKKCIFKTWQCDGEDDCEDGEPSDEKDCAIKNQTLPVTTSQPFLPTNSCNEWMFQCTSKKCIPYWWKCDHVNDCGDHSDEIGCGNEDTSEGGGSVVSTTASPTCLDHKFRCYDGNCIMASWVCDGTKDCQKGEDEDNCKGPATPSCQPGTFACDDNLCLPLAHYCDGRQDCYDGTDEVENCNSSHTKVYQVQMDVDKHMRNSSLFLSWWLPTSESTSLEFMPSICELGNWSWVNQTWVSKTNYLFEGLHPFTMYNMTVFVRVAGKSQVYPPSRYVTAITEEGVPSPPWNVTVSQLNASHVLVNWNSPSEPNGNITDYIVHTTPPIPPISKRQHANQTTIIMESIYEPGKNYSFWVVAKNELYESNNSEVVTLEFDGDSIIEPVQGLIITSQSNRSVTLSWKLVTRVEGYLVTPKTNPPIPRMDTIPSKSNNFTVTNLAPGTTYIMEVSAYRKSYTGPPSTISFTTYGVALPPISQLTAEISKDHGTTVKLSWEPPNYDTKEAWQYGIYYALTAERLFDKPKMVTGNTSAVISTLEACESYMFAVGLVAPLGCGPLSSYPKTVMTRFNKNAPPKNLKVFSDPMNETRMIVTWSSSCPTMSDKVQYTIMVTELNSNQTFKFTFLPSSMTNFTHWFAVHYGGRYNVSLHTASENATPSLLYVAPAIPPPRQVQVSIEQNGSYIIFWKEAQLPKALANKRYKYLVFVSEGRTLNLTTAKQYETMGPPFVLGNMQKNLIYSFAIVLETDDGYRSLMSEVDSVKVLEGSQTVLSTSNLVSVVVPVVLVVVVLVAALAFFVLRHRRLQRSFVSFANSHYDTRSGAATFSGGDGLDEEDSPVIRGFSDDEPLVIA